MNYIVKWEIDIEADSPEEAAKLAREYQSDDTIAQAFDVTDESGQTVLVDLLDSDKVQDE